jgi:hypothetical protein
VVAVVVLLTSAIPQKGVGKRDHWQFFGSRLDPDLPPPPAPSIKQGENSLNRVPSMREIIESGQVEK